MATPSTVTLPATGEDFTTQEQGDGSHLQEVVLVFSDRTLVVGDATNGVKVYTANALPAGTNNIGDVDVLTVPTDPFGANADSASATGSISAKLRYIASNGIPLSAALPAGTAYIGKTRMTDGTTDADIIDLGTYAGPGQYILDGGGDPVTFSLPSVLTATTTDAETSALDAGDSIHDTILSFSNAAAVSGGTGHITRAMLLDKDDQGIEADLYLFAQSVTVPASDAAWSLSDSDAAYLIDTITFSTYEDHANNQTSVVRPAPPIPYYCNGGTTLYGHLVTRGTPTYTATGLTVVLQVQPD